MTAVNTEIGTKQVQAGAAELWRVSPASLASYLSTLGGADTALAWHPAKHLLMVSQVFAAAAYNSMEMHTGDKILISMPPRHGKSNLISIWAPIWALNMWPHAKIIQASYGAELATDFSRTSRDLAEEYEEYLDFRIRPDMRQAGKWGTTAGGQVIAAGVGGPITGRGANILIIDDYLKNSEEAASKAQRNKNHNWFTSTALTRLEPGGFVIIVATRWHPDDLIGRLEKDKLGGWKNIQMSGIAGENDPLGRSQGQALWPERYNEDVLAETKRNIGTYYWKALYEQKPQASRAGLFKGDWFQKLSVIPDMDKLVKVRSWDFAATINMAEVDGMDISPEGAATDPDYSVGALLGYDIETHNSYILDIVRLQGSPADVERVVAETAESDGYDVTVVIEQEPGASGKSLVNMYARYVLQDYVVRGERASGPKLVRANPMLAAAENNSLRMLLAPWNDVFMDEVEQFPEGDHDDQVDAVALGFLHLKLELKRRGVTFGRPVKHTKGLPLSRGVTFGRRIGNLRGNDNVIDIQTGHRRV